MSCVVSGEIEYENQLQKYQVRTENRDLHNILLNNEKEWKIQIGENELSVDFPC